jgi:hypothetical protein
MITNHTMVKARLGDRIGVAAVGAGLKSHEQFGVKKQNFGGGKQDAAGELR